MEKDDFPGLCLRTNPRHYNFSSRQYIFVYSSGIVELSFPQNGRVKINCLYCVCSIRSFEY